MAVDNISFSVIDIGSHSAVVEIDRVGSFDIELGTTSSGVDEKKAADAFASDNEVVWKTDQVVLGSTEKQYRFENLQPNYQYFVRVAGNCDEIESFWTIDWPEEEKVQASIVKNGDFASMYAMGRRLGRGHFGDVNLCVEKQVDDATNKTGNYVYAVKVMKVARRQQAEAAQNEISILRDLRHKNIVWLKQAIWAPRSTLYLVMEFISGGELFEKISSDDYLLTEFDCACYLRQICEALAYLHAKNIVHLDLKVENIMLACPARHQIKIVDFGIAKQLVPKVPTMALCGTAEFCAPEVLQYDPITTMTDMWSVGVIAYIMLSGLSPFLGDNDNETYVNVIAGEYDFEDPAFDLISESAKNFISKLIIKPKEQRLTAEKCLEQEWLEAVDSGSGKIAAAVVAEADKVNLPDAMGRRMSVTAIDTTKLKAYWARRKWKKACGALRAVQRLSFSWNQQRLTAPPSVPLASDQKTISEENNEETKS